MQTQQFTLDHLRSVLRAAAGEEDGGVLDADILDISFEDLGYDSVAMLETACRVERELAIVLPDSCVSDARTPRLLLAAVNERLAAAATT